MQHQDHQQKWIFQFVSQNFLQFPEKKADLWILMFSVQRVYRLIGTRERLALSLTAASSDWGEETGCREEEEEEEEKEEKEEELRLQKNTGMRRWKRIKEEDEGEETYVCVKLKEQEAEEKKEE